jgi:hypothetical protein
VLSAAIRTAIVVVGAYRGTLLLGGPEDPPIALMITEIATRIGASPTATHGLMVMNNPTPRTSMVATTDKTTMLVVSRMMYGYTPGEAVRSLHNMKVCAVR